MNYTYTRRDSATKKLKSVGVPRELYNDYLDNVTDAAGASSWVALVDKFKADLARATPLKSARKKSTGAKTGTRDGTVSAVAQAAIIEGKTNEEVWAVLLAQFPHLTIKQKYYPSWYRNYLKRRGYRGN